MAFASAATANPSIPRRQAAAFHGPAFQKRRNRASFSQKPWAIFPCKGAPPVLKCTPLSAENQKSSIAESGKFAVAVAPPQAGSIARFQKQARALDREGLAFVTSTCIIYSEHRLQLRPKQSCGCKGPSKEKSLRSFLQAALS